MIASGPALAPSEGHLGTELRKNSLGAFAYRFETVLPAMASEAPRGAALLGRFLPKLGGPKSARLFFQFNNNSHDQTPFRKNENGRELVACLKKSLAGKTA